MTTIDRATGECADLQKALATRRRFLRFTAQGLTDDQARERTTVSELTLGGLLKHVANTERRWLAFAKEGASAMATPGDRSAAFAQHLATFRMEPDETLDALIADYEAAEAETNAALETLDLDTAHELPKAPWFEPGAKWTVRMVLLHLIGETAQHAGHADIIREALDGQKSMG